jgi:LPS-assembly lipoprotein
MESCVLFKKSVILLMLLLLSACGYHLRGALNLPSNIKSVYLEGGSASLQEEFNKSMAASSVAIAASEQSAGLIIKITNEISDRRILSLSTGGAANYFELGYEFDYELIGPNEKILMPRQLVSIKREYYNNQQAVIAKDNEEIIIRNEMYQQAVRSIVNGTKLALEASSK